MEILLQHGADVMKTDPSNGRLAIAGVMVDGEHNAGDDAPRIFRLLREAGCTPGAVENPHGEDTSLCYLN